MMLGNERGVITVDYLFAMVLVMGFSFIIFALSMTLTMVEVVQYATYASARNYYAASMNPQTQETAAFVKYQSLIQSDIVDPLFTSGWFELNDLTISTDLPGNKPELSDYQQDPRTNLFHGTVVYFTSKVLEFTVPLYGQTGDNEMRGQEEFGAWIGSYLGREVTQEECENLIRVRWERIKALPTNGAASYSAAGGDNDYVGIADNGC